jgi:hypothetical protein
MRNHQPAVPALIDGGWLTPSQVSSSFARFLQVVKATGRGRRND